MTKMVRGLVSPAPEQWSDIQHAHRGIGSNLTYPQLLCRQLGKPLALRFCGSPSVRKGDGAGGTRGRKKRTLGRNSRDRAATCGDTQPERTQTSDWS